VSSNEVLLLPSGTLFEPARRECALLARCPPHTYTSKALHLSIHWNAMPRQSPPRRESFSGLRTLVSPLRFKPYATSRSFASARACCCAADRIEPAAPAPPSSNPLQRIRTALRGSFNRDKERDGGRALRKSASDKRPEPAKWDSGLHPASAQHEAGIAGGGEARPRSAPPYPTLTAHVVTHQVGQTARLQVGRRRASSCVFWTCVFFRSSRSVSRQCSIAPAWVRHRVGA